MKSFLYTFFLMLLCSNLTFAQRTILRQTADTTRTDYLVSYKGTRITAKDSLFDMNGVYISGTSDSARASGYSDSSGVTGYVDSTRASHQADSITTDVRRVPYKVIGKTGDHFTLDDRLRLTPIKGVADVVDPPKVQDI